MAKAVLVDGVGGTREMSVADDLRDVLLPRPTPFKVTVDVSMAWPEPMPISRFSYLGDLPDGVRVYAFVYEAGAQFSIWRVQASWVVDLPDDGVAEVYSEMGRNLDAINPHAPIVRLYDSVTRERSRGLNTRVVMGVARLPKSTNV